MTHPISEELQNTLENICGADNVFAGEPLSRHTTFAIGGPADILVEPASVSEIKAIVRACNQASVPVRFMGLGSNILAPDEGVHGVVVKLAERFARIQIEGTLVTCEAGASNEAVAAAACAANLAGYEFASGIPGTIGGAAIMNAGAYGGEFKDVVRQVVCLASSGDIVTVGPDDPSWGYRKSKMAEEGYIVVGATLQLSEGVREEIQARMDELRQKREDKQPLEMPSAGSTFKRPEGYFAGKLIQDAGLMGYAVGGAQVSTKHAGFVVNAGGATAADVLQLISDVQDRVFANEGVRLEPEVRLWGIA